MRLTKANILSALAFPASPCWTSGRTGAANRARSAASRAGRAALLPPSLNTSARTDGADGDADAMEMEPRAHRAQDRSLSSTGGRSHVPRAAPALHCHGAPVL